MNGMFSCANTALSSYAFLTRAAAALLAVSGSPEQKGLFLPPMLAGRWFGTMCLSEPHAGSSLADIRTKAEPVGATRYAITGSKMWISGGDHELSENIVHFVLAKIPGGPSGTRGISLFVVPKYRVNDDGSLGERNDVNLAGLNHKMGHRGTTNCLLNFGEGGHCIGWLVGEPHEGLRAMFHMMNEARISVGHAAVMSALAGYLYSLDYARTRRQGRPVSHKDPLAPPIPIIEHADVKRMLLAQKAAVEGGLALCAFCARMVDEQKITEDAAAKADTSLLLELLTPIAKSWPSEHCLEANKHAIQILGGYGYTRDYPVERFYRDNRLNQIHEGTFGIHGIDLLGRKVRMQNGTAMRLLFSRLEGTMVRAAGSGALAREAGELGSAMQALRRATETAVDADVILGLANATLYLDAFGTIVVAWLWLWQATVAHDALRANQESDVAFYEGKIAACRYFYRYMLPHVHAQLQVVADLDDTCLAIRPEAFVGN